ncbi:DUF1833 family protein [Alcanivorax sp. IL3]|uniref:DUF1833 family protein n=1 Tax=unclassified Alcanivorax TaxID=2638842 RepID=UPI0039C35CEE
MPTLLNKVYASAPTDAVLIQTLDIRVTGEAPVLLCNGFNEVTATLETEEQVTFEPGNLVVSLPDKNDTGQQSLNFGIWNATGRAQQVVAAALNSGEQVPVVYREYLSNDLSAPQSSPLPFIMVGGEFRGIELQIEASYYDILNSRWPRQIYDSNNAPGLKYL